MFRNIFFNIFMFPPKKATKLLTIAPHPASNVNAVPLNRESPKNTLEKSTIFIATIAPLSNKSLIFFLLLNEFSPLSFLLIQI